jgi:hypothetical protein
MNELHTHNIHEVLENNCFSFQISLKFLLPIIIISI